MGGDPMGFNAPSPNAELLGGAAAQNPGAASNYDAFQGLPVNDSSSDYTSAIPEVSALREWEDKHNAELEEKAREEQNKKNELRANAAAEIQKWNEERLGNIQKKHTTNRADEETFAANNGSPEGASTWEKVVNLIDLNARGSDESRDTSRMRNLLIQLKASPPVKAN